MTGPYPVGRPLLIEVDLGAIKNNLHKIRQAMANRGQERDICAVVKADAYGHGLIQVARALVEEGVSWLGVSALSEGQCLREAGIEARILCLGSAFEGTENSAWEKFKELGVTPAIYQPCQAASLQAWFAHGNKLDFHLKINTGMNRLGFNWTDPDAVKQILGWCGESMEGVFTHLARSDEKSSNPTHEQYQRFFEVLEQLGGPERWRHRHGANSGGILLEQAEWPLTMVRPGLALYGYEPSLNRDGLALEPAMSVTARLIQVQPMSKGQAIGYGGEAVLDQDQLVGVLPAGYGDGISRSLYPKAVFRHALGPCQILGRVSMDLLSVVLPQGAKVGDEVVLMSPDGPTAKDWAAWEGTLHYEVLTRMGRRQGALAKAGGSEPAGR